MEHIYTKTILAIQNEALDIMVNDAQSSFPDECCGFFYGSGNDDFRTITKAVPVINHKEGDKRRRFEIHPQDYIRAERFAVEQNLILLGIYHSHPVHPAVPSETDRLAAQPYFSYLILSVYPGEKVTARSWRLNDQHQFEEEHVNLIQNPSSSTNP